MHWLPWICCITLMEIIEHYALYVNHQRKQLINQQQREHHQVKLLLLELCDVLDEVVKGSDHLYCLLNCVTKAKVTSHL
jgi:hypothetical protein